MYELWISIISSLAGAAIAVAASFLVMQRTNKHSRRLQLRSEAFSLCGEIEILLADFCSLIERYYRVSNVWRHLNISEYDFDESGRETLDIVIAQRDLERLITRVEVKTRDIEELQGMSKRFEGCLSGAAANAVCRETYVKSIENLKDNTLSDIRQYKQKFR